MGVFTLNSKTGMLIVHKPVDREEFPSFTVSVKTIDNFPNQFIIIFSKAPFIVWSMKCHTNSEKCPSHFPQVQLSPNNCNGYYVDLTPQVE